MVFCRVNERKVTTAGDRTVPERRPTGVSTHRTETGLKTLAGRRTVPRRTSADVILYTCRPAPVRYVTTQETNV